MQTTHSLVWLGLSCYSPIYHLASVKIDTLTKSGWFGELALWEQTCVAAPAQQRSPRPKHCPGPDADERHGHGVRVDAVSCKNTQGNVTLTRHNLPNSLHQLNAALNVFVLTRAKSSSEQVRGTLRCSILDLSWMLGLWHLMNNELFSFINTLCKHQQLNGTSVDKVHIELYSKEKRKSIRLLVSESPLIVISIMWHLWPRRPGNVHVWLL